MTSSPPASAQPPKQPMASEPQSNNVVNMNGWSIPVPPLATPFFAGQRSFEYMRDVISIYSGAADAILRAAQDYQKEHPAVKSAESPAAEGTYYDQYFAVNLTLIRQLSEANLSALEALSVLPRKFAAAAG